MRIFISGSSPVLSKGFLHRGLDSMNLMVPSNSAIWSFYDPISKMEGAYLSVWTSVSPLKLQALSELFTAYLHNTLSLAQLSLPRPISDARYAHVEPHLPPSHTHQERSSFFQYPAATHFCVLLSPGVPVPMISNREMAEVKGKIGRDSCNS